jgi:hypothetical protein
VSSATGTLSSQQSPATTVSGMPVTMQSATSVVGAAAGAQLPISSRPQSTSPKKRSATARLREATGAKPRDFPTSAYNGNYHLRRYGGEFQAHLAYTYYRKYGFDSPK